MKWICEKCQAINPALAVRCHLCDAIPSNLTNSYKLTGGTEKDRKLKPCPFCGENEIKGFKYPDEFFFQCQTCTTCGPNGVDEESATVQWNSRATIQQVEGNTK